MITFIFGLMILFIGGALYGRLCEKVFCPDARKTPAYEMEDGVDYIPMKRWKNSLMNLLNIAGTGPILGPIQGILFGPIAFITIPIGCVIGGAMHDYFSGMICTREGGIQMPEVIKRNNNRAVFICFTAFVAFTSFLCAVVFIYTPGDLIATQIFHFGGTTTELSTWIIYGCIFLYYIIATILPINKIIGRIYPIFGMLLLASAVGVFVMLFFTGSPLTEIWNNWTLNGFDFGAYFRSGHFIPMFFVTVACGIMSGFHSTQTALVSRTLQKEKHGRMAFYNMMILEGFIAMVWAAGAMAVIGFGAKNAGITMQMTGNGWGYFREINGALQQVSATSVVGVVCTKMLGGIGGFIAVLGIIILPISTGDTALRSLRLTVAEAFSVKQKKASQRIMLSVPIFAVTLILLVWAKQDPNGFNRLWQYLGWGNQVLSVFATSAIMIYLMSHGKRKYVWMPMIPFVFYGIVTTSYIVYSPLGLGLNIHLAYMIAAAFTILILALTLHRGIILSKRKSGELFENDFEIGNNSEILKKSLH